MGARTATTALLEASSARFAAVLSIDQPPQFESNDHGDNRASRRPLEKTLNRLIL